MAVKLSKRLQTICDLIPADSESVWDMCCDHGHLGQKLLEIGKTVHFVDCVPSIMEKLENELGDRPRMSLYTLDAGKAPIENRPSEVIVIAGVGGWSAIKILEQLMTKNGPLKSTIIASVQKNRDTFVNFMTDHAMELEETLQIEDKGKRYTIDVY